MGYYLIDVGSSSVKVYEKRMAEVFLLEKVSYKFEGRYYENASFELIGDDKTAFFSIIQLLKEKYGLTRSNTKLYATGHFRRLKNKLDFISDFYTHTQLYFNIIPQDLELFFLEKKLSSYSSFIGKIIIFNIGGGSTEIIFCDSGEVINRVKLDWGVKKINQQRYPRINDINNGKLLYTITNEILTELPKMKDEFPTAIYTGGELTFMELLKYPLKENTMFNDIKHPYCIDANEYYSYNMHIFSEMTISDLIDKMPENPVWMEGARACSAIAQAICNCYGVKKIIPSNFNMLDGVVAQEARTVVICGSFNKHLKEISKLVRSLQDKGIEVLSPKSTDVAGSIDGFVVFKHDKLVNNCRWPIESLHLAAIRNCDMVIICNYDNYIGMSTAYELGIAQENGKKVVFIEDNEVVKNFDAPIEIGLL